MKLYDYYRSTASYRVRIALHAKGLLFEQEPVHLVNNGGEQHSNAYKKINPQSLVPSLRLDNTETLTQSLSMIEYLEESYPAPALLPASPIDKAHVRSLSLLIACDMHPLNNLRVLKQLRSQFKADEAAVNDWYHHWLKVGFDAFEKQLQKSETQPMQYCYGNRLSLADICLVPQVFNARRFNFSLADYPLIEAVDAHCQTLPAFKKAAPENQGAAE